MKNKFAALILLLISGIILFSSARLQAGYIEEKDGKTIIHVKVFELPDPSKNDTQTRAQVAVVNRFKEQFPKIFAKKYRAKYKANPQKYGNYNWDNVEIQLDPFSSIKVEGVETDLLAIAGGMAPDILYINFRKSHNYIFNDFLYPLDEYYATMTEAQKKFRINSKLWPVIYRKGPNGKKHYWALPYGGALGKVLLYRKDLFDEFGIEYPTAKWTWKDMMAAAKKLTDQERGTYGIILARGKHEAFLWLTFLWSAGGDVMVYNEDKDQWKCVFDSPEATEALDFYLRLSAEKWYDRNHNIQRGYSTKDSTERGIKWERGEVGMQFAYIEENLAQMNPDLIGSIPVPLGPTGMRGGELNSRMMGMFSQVKEAAVRDAAWEYMFFYDGKEAAEIKTRIMVEGGLGGFVNPEYLRMFGYEEVEKLCPKGWAENFKIAVETGKPEPYGKNSNFAYEIMTEPIQFAENLYRKDKLPKNREERLKVLRKILQDACARANEIMIGKITPKQRLTRRIVAGLFLVAIIVGFFFVFRNIFKAFTPPSSGLGERKTWNLKKYMWAYLLLVPAAGTVIIWQYVPLLRGSGMAFLDYRLIGHSTFVGLDNFGNILFDSKWLSSIWNSLRYSFLVIGLTFLPPVLLAILLQEVPKGKLLFRIIFYLPAVITGLVTILLWKQFYEPSSNGTLNYLLLKIPAIGFIGLGLIMLFLALIFANRLKFYEMYFPMTVFILAGIMVFYTFFNFASPILFPGGNETIWMTLQALPGRLFNFLPEPYNWLSDQETAMVACVIPMVWAGMGPGCLIYLAALKGIPEDYYEASDIDGANFIDKLLFIVFPTIKALIIINFVGVFIRSWFGATANILAMTGGGAQTETAGLHIWYEAFTYLNLGPATAMAWMLAFMLIGFTVYQLRILSRVEFRTAATANKQDK